MEPAGIFWKLTLRGEENMSKQKLSFTGKLLPLGNNLCEEKKNLNVALSSLRVLTLTGKIEVSGMRPSCPASVV